MKILYTTNFPSPYRVDFFNELGKYCELTVAYERERALHRDSKWIGDKAENYRECHLKMKPIGTSQSIGLGIIKMLRSEEYQRVVFCGYASPAVILSILYCRLHRKKYCLEFDGGFNEKDSFFKRILKEFLFRGTARFLITCKDLEEYLKSFGVSNDRISKYPFSSIREKEIISQPFSETEKSIMKGKLGIVENKAIISVGSFDRRKGFDLLIQSANNIDKNIGVYIVGGEPKEEYLRLCSENNLKNIHFIPFQRRNELFEWYRACDVFVLPTRYDIWGLVVNEAMACGLPIVASDMCISAKEMLNNDSAFIFKSEDAIQLAERINFVLSQDLHALSVNSINTAKHYTIENMVREHLTIFESDW